MDLAHLMDISTEKYNLCTENSLYFFSFVVSQSVSLSSAVACRHTHTYLLHTFFYELNT